MQVVDVCESYFRGFQDVAKCTTNPPGITALAVLKIISYFTIVIPAVFAVIYGAASLCGRVSKKEDGDSVDTAVSAQAQQVLRVASPAPTPGQSAPTLGQSAPTLGQSAPTPGQSAPTPGQSAPTLGQSAPTLGQSAPTLGQPAPTPNSRLAVPSSVVLRYTGDLTQSEKSAIKMEMTVDEKTLKINFKQFPAFDVTIRSQEIFEARAEVAVNAANTHLGGGGGIDGEMHKKGKGGYQKAHQALKKEHPSGYPSGKATLIASGSLEPQYGIQGVIVVAGPSGSTNPQKEDQLYSCYYNSLLVAHEAGKTSIAFPSISTGLYGYPEVRAAQISLTAINNFVHKYPHTRLRTISIHFRPGEEKKLKHYKEIIS